MIPVVNSHSVAYVRNRNPPDVNQAFCIYTNGVKWFRENYYNTKYVYNENALQCRNPPISSKCVSSFTRSRIAVLMWAVIGLINPAESWSQMFVSFQLFISKQDSSREILFKFSFKINFVCSLMAKFSKSVSTHEWVHVYYMCTQEHRMLSWVRAAPPGRGPGGITLAACGCSPQISVLRRAWLEHKDDSAWD